MGDIRTHYAMHLQGALYKFCTAYHATKDIFVQQKVLRWEVYLVAMLTI